MTYRFEVKVTVSGVIIVDVDAQSEREARAGILDNIPDRQISEMAHCDADRAILLDEVDD